MDYSVNDVWTVSCLLGNKTGSFIIPFTKNILWIVKKKYESQR